MLTAYPTRSVRHSRSPIGRWLLALPLIAVTAGIAVGTAHRQGVPSMTSFLPPTSEASNAVSQHRTASFRISGPTAAGLAVLMNDSPELRARAEQARIKHASERLVDDTALRP